MTNRIQLTLAIIKPHAVKIPQAIQSIRRVILLNGFYVLRTKNIWMSVMDAEMFYQEHSKKFFFNRLVTLMSSGPSFVHILAKENAIQAWRDLMGPTKVYKTQFTHPKSIRGEYGLSDTRNVVHGSDSECSAEREIKFFFPDFDVTKSQEELSNAIRSENHIQFDDSNFVHLINV